MRRLEPKQLTQKRLIRSLLGFLILALVLAACSSTATESDPAPAVEAYLTAMVANDTAKLPQLVCPAFEADARIDFDSFGAISDATLDGMDCSTKSTDGNSAVVTCKGQITYVYNGENDAQNLADDNYTVQKVDGVWTMCGYQ